MQLEKFTNSLTTIEKYRLLNSIGIGQFKPLIMIINEHTLVHAKDAGNGYHGNCAHCGLALVTDLGYCSWNDTVCIDREVIGYDSVPNEIKDFARFKGLVYMVQDNVFVKPYSEDRYTIDELAITIKSLTHSQ